MDQQGQQSGQTGQETPLREWQKETWMAPIPLHENPFDEPDDAPELLAMRSEELNNRSGEFWQKQPTGYVFGQGDQRGEDASEPGQHTGQTGAGTEKRKPRTTATARGKLGGALAAAGGVILLLLILYFGVFTVREVLVTGNSQIPAGEVIRLSGVRKGTPVFSLDQETVERGIEQNPYLRFRYLDKQLPGTVVIAVSEREACCWMTWNGILYTMDKHRVVLFESEDLFNQPAALVRVDGLKIRSGGLTGQKLVLETREQEDVFTNLFLEMKVLGCTALIEEADLSNLNSLLLTTRDGYTVSLGTWNNLHAKLRSMLLTREELIRRGESGGVINVSLPETPIYSPAAAT